MNTLTAGAFIALGIITAATISPVLGLFVALMAGLKP